MIGSRFCKTAAVGALLCAGLALVSCKTEEPQVNICVTDFAITNVIYTDPVLAGSAFTITGTGFDVECGDVKVAFTGYYAGNSVDIELAPEVESLNQLSFTTDVYLLGRFGSPGSVFTGRVGVKIIRGGYATNEASYPVLFEIDSALQPVLSMVNPPEVTLHAPVTVSGGGYIQGDEGTTYAVLDGTFTMDAGGDFPVTGAETPVYLVEEMDRTRGYFNFAPDIAGINPGTFIGTVMVYNRHADGTIMESGVINASFILGRSFVTGMQPAETTLGGILTIEGAGFIGATTEETLTFLIEGTAYPYGGDPQVVEDLELIGRFLDGGHVQYDVIPTRVENRLIATDFGFQRGSFVGTFTPILSFRGEQIYGIPTEINFSLGPLKQVVFVQFRDSFSRTLREFGLRSVEPYVEEAILDKMDRVYEDVNVEFRADRPEDYYPGGYSVIEVTGPDPNGKGIFGYDNTPGKDVWNLRIHDRIGGVNAETQEDGYPGYGGVFIDSVLCWSAHPSDAVVCPPGFEPEPDFDRVFDPVRNNEIVAGEYPSGPDSERVAQIQEAITVFGNLIGDITAHELGHSLGLAHPYGAPDLFHNEPPSPGCLMDSGVYRPFEERTGLYGTQPGTWCGDERPYLQMILPLP